MSEPNFEISGIIKRSHMQGDIRVIDELGILSVYLCSNDVIAYDNDKPSILERVQRISKIKEDYRKSDVVMSEYLRTYDGDLTVVEKRFLLNWAGEDDLMMVTDDGEIVVKERKDE